MLLKDHDSCMELSEIMLLINTRMSSDQNEEHLMNFFFFWHYSSW
jgi:hypothetical protein